jgi:hypothetical protein
MTHQHSNRKQNSSQVFSDEPVSYIKINFSLLIGMSDTLYYVPPRRLRKKSLKSIAMIKNFLLALPGSSLTITRMSGRLLPPRFNVGHFILLTLLVVCNPLTDLLPLFEVARLQFVPSFLKHSQYPVCTPSTIVALANPVEKDIYLFMRLWIDSKSECDEVSSSRSTAVHLSISFNVLC